MFKFVAFTVVALTGAVLVATEPASSAGGFRGAGAIRGLPGGRSAIPFFPRRARAGFLRTQRFPFARGPFAAAPARFFRPASPHGFATTTPLHPFAHLARRHHHRIDLNGWYYPVTTSDDPTDPGFIGTPYDPSEAIPVYAPAPAADPAPLSAPLTSRTAEATEDNRGGCRSERVTVPSASGGERTITIVRC